MHKDIDAGKRALMAATSAMLCSMTGIFVGFPRYPQGNRMLGLSEEP